MIIFNTDLDNTIIYSYKHDIGRNKRNVELYNGREISFITEKTYELLRLLKQKMLIVPTTTRTIEQYNRIDLGIGGFKYALVCNGGVLLENGRINREWYDETKRLIAESREELYRGRILLEEERGRYFEVRCIEDMFLFTKCRDASEVVLRLEEILDTRLVRVYSNGDKVYIIPSGLKKGDAVRRFKEYTGASEVIAAGDSEFDISMLEEADYGLAPCGFGKMFSVRAPLNEMKEEGIFSEQLLAECIKIAAHKRMKK